MPKAPEKPPITPLKDGQTVTPGVSDAQYRLIGRVIVHWSLLEGNMQDALWALVGVPIEDGRILTQRTDATRKLQWLMAFAKRHLVGEEKEEMSAILGNIESLRSDRNFIAHGSWGTLIPDNIPIAASVREKSDKADEIIMETFPQGRMEAIISDITKANISIISWRNKHEASRGTPPPQDPSA